MTDKPESTSPPRGGVTEILRSLPGLGGYKEREIRREVDRRVRDAIVHTLESVRRSLNDVQQDVLQAGGIRWMDDFERVQSRLTLLADKVRSAAYGYRPLFDLERVDETVLERLIRFDREILQQAADLEARVAAVREAATQSAEALGQALQALYDAVSRLLATYGERDRWAQQGETTEPPSAS